MYPKGFLGYPRFSETNAGFLRPGQMPWWSLVFVAPLVFRSILRVYFHAVHCRIRDDTRRHYCMTDMFGKTAWDGFCVTPALEEFMMLYSPNKKRLGTEQTPRRFFSPHLPYATRLVFFLSWISDCSSFPSAFASVLICEASSVSFSSVSFSS
jgi:hypothetical protein